MSTHVFERSNYLLMKRGKKAYLDSKTADVKFMVKIGDDEFETVSAHKIILSVGSPVFETMFYGSMKEESDVKIVDASLGAFKEFLQFFYLGKLRLTCDNIIDVTKLCHKYEVTDALAPCETALQKLPTINDMCSVYELANLLELESTIKFCEKKIKQNPQRILKSDDFLDCDQNTLDKILNLMLPKSLSHSASTIVDSCMNWATRKCQVKDIEATPPNLKNEFGSLIVKIRTVFAKLSKDEFVRCMKVYRGLLSDTDFEAIIFNIMEQKEKAIKEKKIHYFDL